MDKMKDMRAEIDEMRSVAQRLMTWASDREQSLQKETSAAPLPPAADPPAASVTAATLPSRAEVKAFLTTRCAAGYAAQVKALIASFGVSSLSEVPEESLASLMERASLRGEGEENAGYSSFSLAVLFRALVFLSAVRSSVRAVSGPGKCVCGGRDGSACPVRVPAEVLVGNGMRGSPAVAAVLL